jgi:hypothetical protein
MTTDIVGSLLQLTRRLLGLNSKEESAPAKNQKVRDPNDSRYWPNHCWYCGKPDEDCRCPGGRNYEDGRNTIKAFYEAGNHETHGIPPFGEDFGESQAEIDERVFCSICQEDYDPIEEDPNRPGICYSCQLQQDLRRFEAEDEYYCAMKKWYKDQADES